MKYIWALQNPKSTKIELFDNIETLIRVLSDRKPGVKIFSHIQGLHEAIIPELKEISVEDLLERFVKQTNSELSRSAITLRKLVRFKNESKNLKEEFEIVAKFEVNAKPKNEEPKNESEKQK